MITEIERNYLVGGLLGGGVTGGVTGALLYWWFTKPMCVTIKEIEPKWAGILPLDSRWAIGTGMPFVWGETTHYYGYAIGDDGKRYEIGISLEPNWYGLQFVRLDLGLKFFILGRV